MPHRILYFNSWSSAHGGSSTSLLDIVRHLDRSAFEPMVVCPEPGELPRRLGEAGVPVVIHSLSKLNRQEVWRFLLDVPWYVRLLRQYRIALVHGNTSAPRRSLLQAASLLGLPYVQHVRNFPRQTTSYGYRLATRIVANSSKTAAPFLDDPMTAAKVVTIHNGVDLAQYDAGDDRRAEIGADRQPIVGFVGQLVPRKGVTTLIRAMPAILAHVPSALLVVVGTAPPDERAYEASCRALAAELGIAERVLFTGYRHDIPAWMRTFDVFVLPTRSEPFGKVVVEAMAAGRPVIASAVGGIPEIITDPSLGSLVPPDDPQAICREALQYLSDPQLATRVGEASARHVRARFSLTTMVNRLEALYTAVLARHGSRVSVINAC